MPDQPEDKKENSSQFQESPETGKSAPAIPGGSEVRYTDVDGSGNQAGESTAGEEQHGSVKNSK